MSKDHANPSLDTFVALIWSSGLNRVSDQSRLYEIQSSLLFPASRRALSLIRLAFWPTATQATMPIRNAATNSCLTPCGLTHIFNPPKRTFDWCAQYNGIDFEL